MTRPLFFCLLASGLCGQGVDYVKANYTKYEYLIPARDGVKLFTSVYVPKDTAQPYPILLLRTPYSVAPYGVDKYRTSLGPSEQFARNSFIFAYQDVRGRYQSQGKFVEMRPHQSVRKDTTVIDESTDTWDTIDWMVKSIPNNNGRVGTYGISYPGFYAAAGMIDAHPAHKAASPQAPIADLFQGDDAYHNGAFMLAANFGFYLSFKPHLEPTTGDDIDRRNPIKSPDGYDTLLRAGGLANLNEKFFKNTNPYWLEMVSNSTYNEYWKQRAITPHIRNIKPAVLTVGGWFDAEDLAGPQNIAQAVRENGPQGSHHLVIGPWSHGQWSRGDGDKLGDVSFAQKTSVHYRDNIEYPFFNFHLKGKGKDELPAATMFATGINEWRKFDSWPPKGAVSKMLYFHAGGKLSFDAPSEAEAFDEYVSDPNKPVPYIGKIVSGMVPEYMTGDQRFASRRPDVLTFETDVLEDDVTIAGSIIPRLDVSITRTDADFVVKIIDVYPDDLTDPTPNPTGVRLGGYQQLVRGEPFRGKFRNSLEKPEAFTPGKPTRIGFRMPDVLHTFRRGHRIMVQVQSSWFPLIDRNPQKFMNIVDAKAADFTRATHRIYRSKAAASGIKIGVLPR